MPVTRKQGVVLGSVAAVLVAALVVGLSVGLTVGRRKPKTNDVQQRVRNILTDNPLIDGHNDWPWVIRKYFRNKIAHLDLNDMSEYDLGDSLKVHTDITRLRKGQVGGQFWSIYTPCEHQGKDATVSFMEQIDVVHRIIEKEPGAFRLARTAAEVRQAFADKRIASLLGVESGQAIESTFAVLRLFYQLGVRYMTLTHNCNTPWADQNRVDRPNSTLDKNDGLTEFGVKIIDEMNRLGMLVDLAHVSKKTMLDVLRVSRSPVIFSHSSAWALCNHSRNVQDDVLRLVKDNRGVVMVAFTPGFISCVSGSTVGIPEVAAHINYIRDIVGADGVGLGSDFDGIDRTPIGLEDVSTYPALLQHLMSQHGWSDEDIIKLAGGNVLRVMEDNEKKAKELQEVMTPLEELIPLDDLVKTNVTMCRYLDMYSNVTVA